MSIGAIGAAAASAITPPTMPSAPAGLPVAEGAEASKGFGQMVGDAIQNVNGLQVNADQLAVQASTGDLADVHEYTIAATKAELATQLTVSVRDRAVTAFNEIMRMPL